MMKHLFLYPWIFAALVLAILACVVLIIYMLMQFPDSAAIIPAGAHLVQEVFHATLL